MKKYTEIVRTPEIVRAMRFTKENTQSILDFFKSAVPGKDPDGVETIAIVTIDGLLTARQGDYIVQDESGNVYPMRRDAFKRKFIGVKQ